MKTKKILLTIFALIISTCAIFLLSSCGECEHSFGEWKTVTQQTCTEKGVKERECTLCGHKETGEIEIHTPEIIPGAAPTCSKAGVTEGKKCSVCDEILLSQTELPIDPQAHVITVIPAIEATCTGVGFSEAKKCTECNTYLVERVKLDKLPHTPTNKEGSAPTCMAWGSNDSTVCSVCDAIMVYGYPIPPLDHDVDENGICKNCKLPYEYSDDLEYVLSEDETYYIVKGRGQCTDNDIVIPDMHLGKPVKEIGNGAFYMDTNISYLKIGNNVTKIGDKAFFSSASFSYLQIPDSVTYIGALAFDFCTQITIVDIGAGLESLSPTAFHRATNIKRIIVSEDNDNFKAVDNVLYTKDGKGLALAARNGADSLVVPDGVESIWPTAFYYSQYKTVTLPSSVKSIGEEAFYRAQIEKIEGGAGLETIEAQAFTGSNLSEITLGNKLTLVGELAFSSTKLKSITVPGSLAEIQRGSFFATSSLKSVTIENGVKIIGNEAFKGVSISNIIIPDSVEKISSSAFTECAELTSVTIGKGVTELNNNAFLGCSKLAVITVSEENTVYSSVDGVLCTKDKTELKLYPAGKSGFTVPSSVKVLATGSVQSYMGKEITLPESIETISVSAFLGCDNLEKIILGKNVSTVNGVSFNGCVKLKEVKVSEENEVFSDVDGILCSADKTKLIYFPYARTDSEIPSCIKVICSASFSNSGIKELVIPDTVEIIESNAFNGCEAITKITVGKGVTTIGDGAFKYCTSLIYLYIPTNVTEVGVDVVFFNAYYVQVYCQAESKPDGWNDEWNSYGAPVIWGHELQSAE
ncbi:MAG: leucine-rich repeat domain-containing protein [Clostridia bacterium]|nr:leucine-rich repeat domain-containing protein [Clostridia bacterium]